MAKKRAVQPMKAGSFRDSVAKTVRLLTRDQVKVMFRGFQPCVMTNGDNVIAMVLPEINDNASPELIEAMQGFLDHECGHIFFTPFKRVQDELKKLPAGEARMRQRFNNIVEDIRLEKLLPRELPGTKDNLERMYDAVMEKFFGRAIRAELENGANPERMMGSCIVIGFRAMAGQKAFQRFMDDNNLWPWLTPLTSRMPTLSKELQSMETYDDVDRIVQMVLDAMEPTTKERFEEAMNQAPPEDLPPIPMDCDGSGENDENEGDQDEPSDDAPDREQDGDGGDAGDEEGNSSEGDEADEGEGGSSDEEDDDSADAQGSSGGEAGEDSDKDSEDEGGGKGHGDGSGEDDGSDEEGGKCSSDEGEGEDNGHGDPDADTSEEGDQSSSDSNSEGKSNRSITDALKQLEPTQRKVLYLHKNKKRSVTRIAEKMQISEDEVKSLLGSARRSLASIMTGSK